ncbi:MAG TPA: hypothetical protein VGH89_39395 [Pseudonocardia sp.]|jgi:hypothetical protein
MVAIAAIATHETTGGPHRGIVSLGHRQPVAAARTDPALARFLGWRHRNDPTTEGTG